MDGLGVEGGLVGFAAGCGELYAWSPATGHSKRVPREVTDCSSTGSYGDVAVAADSVVWVSVEEHNHLYLGVHVVRAPNPAVVSSLYDAIDEDMGDLAAAGAVVAFSTQGGSYAVSGPRATLWAGTTSRVAQLTTASGWMDRVAVEGEVVALGYRDGRVRLFRTRGARILSLGTGTAGGGLDLDGGRLVTLAKGRVAVRTLSGSVLLSRLVRTGGGRTELLDARDGLVVYRSGSRLRLLRLADARDVVVRTPRTPVEHLHAAFGDVGLVVAHLAVSSRLDRGGVVRLLTKPDLDRMLARGN